MSRYLFSSEAVSDGHPDKICDQIADAIVDLYLTKNKKARVACEVLVTKGQVVLAGEVTAEICNSQEIEATTRDCLKKIGCTDPHFHWQTVAIQQYLHSQAEELAVEADLGKAGDQGIMFGYASNETPDLMPAPLYYAQKIMTRLRVGRQTGQLPMLGPDGKSQITVQYLQQGNSLLPEAITAIVVSQQHLPHLTPDDVKTVILPYLEQALPKQLYTKDSKLHINCAGNFIDGGPTVDTGLTGRKIVVDTYGAWVPNGGGSFSGKDGTKVDRSGAYMARYLAKNIVASQLASRCKLQIAYGIALDDPVSLYVNTFGTGKTSDAFISQAVLNDIDLSPRGIIAQLHLEKPNYQQTAWGGHFGHLPQPNGAFSWEKLDLVDFFNQI